MTVRREALISSDFSSCGAYSCPGTDDKWINEQTLFETGIKKFLIVQDHERIRRLLSIEVSLIGFENPTVQ